MNSPGWFEQGRIAMAVYDECSPDKSWVVFPVLASGARVWYNGRMEQSTRTAVAVYDPEGSALVAEDRALVEQCIASIGGTVVRQWGEEPGEDDRGDPGWVVDLAPDSLALEAGGAMAKVDGEDYEIVIEADSVYNRDGDGESGPPNPTPEEEA